MAASSNELASGSPRSVSAWSEHLTKHLHVLRDHLEFWNELRSAGSSNKAQQKSAQRCIDDTHVMIARFEELQASLGGASLPSVRKSQIRKEDIGHRKNPTDGSAEPDESKSDLHQPSSRLKENIARAKAGANNDTKDKSELFTVDPNPTPVDSLRKSKESLKADKNLKRKISSSALHPLGASAPLQEIEHLPKRTKTASHEPLAKSVSTSTPTNDRDSTEDDSFMGRFQKEHQAEEARRQKKRDKKRKRESNISTDSQTPVGALPDRSSKRLKRKPEAEHADLTAESINTKKRRSMHDDQDVATGHMAPELQKKSRKS